MLVWLLHFMGEKCMAHIEQQNTIRN